MPIHTKPRFSSGKRSCGCSNGPIGVYQFLDEPRKDAIYYLDLALQGLGDFDSAGFCGCHGRSEGKITDNGSFQPLHQVLAGKGKYAKDDW